MNAMTKRASGGLVLLLLAAPQGLFLSLAHKRWAQNEAGKVVLDGEPATVDLALDLTAEHPFMQALALARQPQANLLALYQGWMDCLTAWQAAKVTGTFTAASTPASRAEARMSFFMFCLSEGEGRGEGNRSPGITDQVQRDQGLPGTLASLGGDPLESRRFHRMSCRDATICD
mgnify:CR=1 FL=1